MKCKACNNPLSDNQQWFYTPAGSEVEVAETCCLACLNAIRTSRHTSVLDETEWDLSFVLGTRYVETSTEG